MRCGFARRCGQVPFDWRHAAAAAADAQVEIAAKVFHGYHAGAGYAGMDEKRLDGVVGREYVPDPSAQRVA